MKMFAAILLTVLLAGCTGYGYPVRDGGDGVYYASSPPVYTYVDGYFGFPYYGPYSWSWYYPVWYTPLAGPHYSWYRSYGFWAMTGAPYRPPTISDKSEPPAPVDSGPDVRPIMPVDLGQMAVRYNKPVYDLQHRGFRSPGTKGAYVKFSQPKSRSNSTSSAGHRAAGPSPRPSGRSSRASMERQSTEIQ